ncbi:MAG: superoxide dismutase family protein [Hyphomonadaceae bacterium]|nr:superoxide dismutase family protein [Hyphomonadaceae bacterium]
MRQLAALVSAAFLSGCTLFGFGDDDSPAPDPALAERTVWIVGTEGRAIGQATFSSAPGGTLIRLEFSERSLPAGWHGAHLHHVGDCSDFAAGFQASRGHLGAGERVAHGHRQATGPEAGDLINIYAPASGVFGAEVFAPYVRLASRRVPGNANTREVLPLFDEDGTALVIHANPDDHASQPVGGAGSRLACAALRATP